AFETLARGHPSPAPAVFKNLGVAYREQSRTRPEALGAMVRAWRRYLDTNPRNDPDVPNIRRLIEETEARESGSRPYGVRTTFITKVQPMWKTPGSRVHADPRQ